ncbi:S8 family peptidase [Povalibacter sp.]|uniref:S8 family peptidase n=1 Tax=Povalibacter sp. TaxID=1962978 RepID=UPI002F415F26
MTRCLTILGLLVACVACTMMPRSHTALPLGVRSHPENFVVVTVRNDQVPMSSRAGSTLRGYDNATSYSATVFARSIVRSLGKTYGLSEVSGWPIAELGIHCVVFALPAGESAAAMIARLQHDDRVESAQPLNAFGALTSPDGDPYRALQTNLAAMEVTAAHRWSRGAGIDVAVIDTGVDTSHPDLVGRVVEQQNFVDSDDASFRRDRHGTAVAGVIAADSDNRVGIVGIAPESRLHVYKACWQNATAGASCNTFTLARGLAAAISARVQVVNLSLAGPADSLLTRLVLRGQQRGIVFVGAAAANANDNAFPTGIEGVLKAAASETADAGDDALHAPGVDVLTLAPDGHYDFVSGSSLAAASVTGTAALLLSLNRTLGAARLRELLASQTGVDASRRINACAAVASLTNASCPAPP